MQPTTNNGRFLAADNQLSAAILSRLELEDVDANEAKRTSTLLTMLVVLIGKRLAAKPKTKRDTGPVSLRPQRLTALDVAEILGVSEKSIYRLARTDELPCVRVGRRVVFDADAVSEFASRRRS